MDNEFTKVMSRATDGELARILALERYKYTPEAILAAEKEFQGRNLDLDFFKEGLEKESKVNHTKSELKENTASSATRLLNFLIDSLAGFLLTVILGILLNFLLPDAYSVTTYPFDYLLLFGSFMFYYTFMEMRFQKTIGKFITRTKVVNLDGSRPSPSVIITRSLCRLIPFDRISFMFTKVGFHDSLSETRVVRKF